VGGAGGGGQHGGHCPPYTRWRPAGVRGGVGVGVGVEKQQVIGMDVCDLFNGIQSAGTAALLLDCC
jgi:hypothetical protein